MGNFATGVTVVTIRHPDGGPAGLTVNSLTSVSLEPPLVLFCLDRAAHIYPLFRRAKFFAVNILGETQEAVSRHFADFRHNPKPKRLWAKPQGGCPILNGTLGWMVCRKMAVHQSGDHDIIIGEAVKLHVREPARAPLLYFHGRYRRLKKA